ncbi:MAG: ABC transporter permease, partial [Gammaproteobacteria bacterium]
RRLFVLEAVMLAAPGALVGLLAGLAGALAVGALYPVFPVATPRWAMATAVGVAVVTGLVFGVVPARRAAALDPIEALAKR